MALYAVASVPSLLCRHHRTLWGCKLFYPHYSLDETGPLKFAALMPQIGYPTGFHTALQSHAIAGALCGLLLSG